MGLFDTAVETVGVLIQLGAGITLLASTIIGFLFLAQVFYTGFTAQMNKTKARKEQVNTESDVDKSEQNK